MILGSSLTNGVSKSGRNAFGDSFHYFALVQGNSFSYSTYPNETAKKLLKQTQHMGQTSFTIDTKPIKKLNFTYLNIIQIRAAYMVPNATRVALHPIFVIIFITFFQVALPTSGCYFFSWTSHCIVFCCFLVCFFHDCYFIFSPF